MIGIVLFICINFQLCFDLNGVGVFWFSQGLFYVPLLQCSLNWCHSNSASDVVFVTSLRYCLILLIAGHF